MSAKTDRAVGATAQKLGGYPKLPEDARYNLPLGEAKHTCDAWDFFIPRGLHRDTTHGRTNATSLFPGWVGKAPSQNFRYTSRRPKGIRRPHQACGIVVWWSCPSCCPPHGSSTRRLVLTRTPRPPLPLLRSAGPRFGGPKTGCKISA